MTNYEKTLNRAPGLWGLRDFDSMELNSNMRHYVSKIQQYVHGEPTETQSTETGKISSIHLAGSKEKEDTGKIDFELQYVAPTNRNKRAELKLKVRVPEGRHDLEELVKHIIGTIND